MYRNEKVRHDGRIYVLSRRRVHFPCVDQVPPGAWRVHPADREGGDQDCKADHESEESPVYDHPPFRCKTREPHVESNDGHLDPCGCLVEHDGLSDGNVLEHAIFVVGNIVHMESRATIYDSAYAENWPRHGEELCRTVSLPTEMRYNGT